MNPKALYSLSKSKVNPKVFAFLLESCRKITHDEALIHAKRLGLNEGFNFLAFCKEHSLIRPKRFSDKWQRNYPHSVARKYPKSQKRDYMSITNAQYREVY